ncbi:MAG TPA: Gfo/Idh/MocA family oxidoreductase [Chthonomonadales bacterium]|nr:Gfo/Idh/MocA family oxidoreductase [Chthonomonadales bacterium]
MELTAFCNLDAKRAECAAEVFDVKRIYTDFRAMLAEKLDAVSICTPNVFHAPMSIAAFGATYAKFGPTGEGSGERGTPRRGANSIWKTWRSDGCASKMSPRSSWKLPGGSIALEESFTASYVMKIVDAVYQSYATGTSVEIRLILGFGFWIVLLLT